MKGCRLALFLGLILLISLFVVVTDQVEAEGTLKYMNKDFFASGMNLAWLSFAQDLDRFYEPRFIRALDEVAAAGGNTVRWWLHTNCKMSPMFKDGKVSGLHRSNIPNLVRALDLAEERGIVLLLSLFSFDMLQDQPGVNLVNNKNLLEQIDHTQAYIDNALIPMVQAVKDHPALFAWEIFNEPEGMARPFGWTPVKTEMKYIQQFVNLVTGAIKREAPHNLVTNGSWNFRVLTDVGGMMNYYRDDRLIEAGGDTLGVLDFYQVHFYPVHFDESTSPFHKPASYWELDKPILIGEFPAYGVLAKSGQRFRPRTELNAEEAWVYALENGYAGALGWTWTNHDGNGGVKDAEPGMKKVLELAPERVVIDQDVMNESE
ncbi:MAG: cellulase family glycosylhydrolase [Bacillota bacterium]|nr:putative mannanase [uncultured bacterium]MDI9413949.1 cellulase family glycosylhydrolase [Bacillota bacterium]